MRSIGLDLGAREVAYCEVDKKVVVQRRTEKGIEALRDLVGPGTEKATIAIEACREAWAVHDLLVEWGHTVLLVDTTRVRALGIGNGRKTDRVDAEILARAVESGHIPKAHVLSPARRALREELSVRRALVEARASFITTVRGLARAHREKIASVDASDFEQAVHRAVLSKTTRTRIAPLMEIFRQLTRQLVCVDNELELLCAEDTTIERLTSMPGVGLVVAAAFVSVIDGADRFKNAHQVEAYLGLVPSENTSGGRNKRRLGSITKHGNSYLRSLLVQAAHVLRRSADKDDPLREWVQNLVGRKSSTRIAVVALARRIAGILWAMLKRGTLYDPSWVSHRSASGLEGRAAEAQAEADAMKRIAHKNHQRKLITARRVKRSTLSSANAEAQT